jgi:hypothetical protein
MGRTTGRMCRSPFANQRPALVKLLGDNEPAATWLESMVATYLRMPSGRMSGLRAGLRTSVAAQIKALRKIETATRLLRTQVDRLAKDGAAFQSLAYAVESGGLAAHPCELLDAFATAAQWAQHDIAGPDNHPGAPVNADRRLLEYLAASALLRAGVPLRKSEKSALAKVLRLVYEAANMNYPIDLLPVLDRLVRASKNGGLILSTL